MFQLPDHYAYAYKGFGGGGSEAAMKIQHHTHLFFKYTRCTSQAPPRHGSHSSQIVRGPFKKW